jgi:hypothetical protein
MSTPTFSPLTDRKQAWVRDQLDLLPGFVNAYSAGDSGLPVTLAILDRAFALWVSTDVQEITQINAELNVVGIRFGQFLVDAAGFHWVIATDEHGSDLAVLALPGRGDVVVYPANFVAKRWEKRQTIFLVEAFAWICEKVEHIEAAWTTGP